MKGRIEGRNSRKTMSRVLIILAAAAVVLRIVYVNTVQYPTQPSRTYTLNETVLFRDFEITITDYTIYTGSQLQELFDLTDSSYVDETEIVLAMHVRYIGDESKRLDVTSFALEYDYISGGNINPILFNYFNADLSGLNFEAGEEKDILLPYPLNGENPQLVISLYPQKLMIKI
ncbi:MAG: hypothetical protein LUC95_09055 [Lachnospiraceae bacterium]|nr:hypothetical protein [Lachnospiraceae bacterium]